MLRSDIRQVRPTSENYLEMRRPLSSGRKRLSKHPPGRRDILGEASSAIIKNLTGTLKTETEALGGWKESHLGRHEETLGGEAGGGESGTIHRKKSHRHESGREESDSGEGGEAPRTNSGEESPGEEDGGESPGQESCESGSGGEEAIPSEG